MIRNYSEWAFAMYPGVNLEDVVAKTQTLSNKHALKQLLQKLRDQRDARSQGLDHQAEEESGEDRCEAEQNGAANGSDPSTQQRRLERVSDAVAVKGVNQSERVPLGFAAAPLGTRHFLDFGQDPDDL